MSGVRPDMKYIYKVRRSGTGQDLEDLCNELGAQGFRPCLPLTDLYRGRVGFEKIVPDSEEDYERLRREDP